MIKDTDVDYWSKYCIGGFWKRDLLRVYVLSVLCTIISCLGGEEFSMYLVAFAIILDFFFFPPTGANFHSPHPPKPQINISLYAVAVRGQSALTTAMLLLQWHAIQSIMLLKMNFTLMYLVANSWDWRGASFRAHWVKRGHLFFPRNRAIKYLLPAHYLTIWIRNTPLWSCKWYFH